MMVCPLFGQDDMIHSFHFGEEQVCILVCRYCSVQADNEVWTLRSLVPDGRMDAHPFEDCSPAHPAGMDYGFLSGHRNSVLEYFPLNLDKADICPVQGGIPVFLNCPFQQALFLQALYLQADQSDVGR